MENGQQPHGRRRMRPGSQYLNNMTTPPLMWDDSISTPFPFFQLPREIRDHIYAELFLSKRKDKIVTPDLGRTRRKPNAQCKANRYSRRRLAYRTLNLTSLAFLRTCQQACDEAADVLYGKHVFHFSDQPHLEKPSANTALSWASNEHRMPLCDFVTVLAFFRSLSSTSRKKLHHLQIEFLTRGLVAPSASSEIAWESHPLRGGPDLVEVLKMVTAEFELRTFRVVFNKPLQSYNDHYFLMETFWNLLKYSFLRQECYGPNSVLERAQMNIVNAIDALQVTQDMTQRLPDDAHLLADPEKGFLLTGNRKGSRALPRRRQQFPREVSLYASEPFNQWYASRLTSQLKAKVLCLTGESLRDRLILQAVYEEHVSKNLSADMVELFLGQEAFIRPRTAECQRVLEAAEEKVDLRQAKLEKVQLQQAQLLGGDKSLHWVEVFILWALVIVVVGIYVLAAALEVYDSGSSEEGRRRMDRAKRYHTPRIVMVEKA